MQYADDAPTRTVGGSPCRGAFGQNAECHVGIPMGTAPPVCCVVVLHTIDGIPPRRWARHASAVGQHAVALRGGQPVGAGSHWVRLGFGGNQGDGKRGSNGFRLEGGVRKQAVFAEAAHCVMPKAPSEIGHVG